MSTLRKMIRMNRTGALSAALSATLTSKWSAM